MSRSIMMKTMMMIATVIAIVIWFQASVAIADDKDQGKSASVATSSEAQGPLIQIAILLDTSGSMDGLIEQAKTRLWSVINEFALARRNGKPPRLEVALYHYGNNGLKVESHWVQQILPLNNDLDKVSEQLFKLRTNGGEEYCAAAIKHAVENLKWDESRDVYKAIFIAGNEPFNQGPINFREVCPKAIAKGILINTIHCGNPADGLATFWKDGALLSDGAYLNIDQNQKLADVPTPHDKEIVALNTSLNKTYIPYGANGAWSLNNQAVQDSNALNSNFRAFANRGQSKTSVVYCTADWDLVEAIELKKVDLAKIKKEDLPKDMQSLSLEGCQKIVSAKSAERKDIQKKLADLTIAREKFVKDELKKMSKLNVDTLEEAIVKTVRSQAAGRNLTFPDLTKTTSQK